MSFRESCAMSGVKYLMDTNFILAILKGHPAVTGKIVDLQVSLDLFGYSSITRVELLGFPAITQTETDAITDFLSEMTYCPLNRHVEDECIKLRKQYRIKLPDALILASAVVNKCSISRHF